MVNDTIFVLKELKSLATFSSFNSPVTFDEKMVKIN